MEESSTPVTYKLQTWREKEELKPGERRHPGGSGFTTEGGSGFPAVFNFEHVTCVPTTSLSFSLPMQIASSFTLELTPLGLQAARPVPFGELFGHPYKCTYSHGDWSDGAGGLTEYVDFTCLYSLVDVFYFFIGIDYVSGRAASPTDEPAEGETRGEAAARISEIDTGEHLNMEENGNFVTGLIIDTDLILAVEADSDSEQSEVEESLNKWRCKKSAPVPIEEPPGLEPVSYTHLTLPTNREV